VDGKSKARLLSRLRRGGPVQAAWCRRGEDLPTWVPPGTDMARTLSYAAEHADPGQEIGAVMFWGRKPGAGLIILADPSQDWAFGHFVRRFTLCEVCFPGARPGAERWGTALVVRDGAGAAYLGWVENTSQPQHAVRAATRFWRRRILGGPLGVDDRTAIDVLMKCRLANVFVIE
jgi:hypothetical protein